MEQRSVAVLVHVTSPFRVLILRRPAARAAGWQVVTGRLERGDADAGTPAPPWEGPAPAVPDADALARAAAREVREETGLPAPAKLRDLGLESTFEGYDGHTYRQRFLAARYDDARPVTLSEHEEARWVDADEANALLRWPEDKTALRLLRERLPPEKPQAEGPAY